MGTIQDAEAEIRAECEALANFLAEKNRRYGDSALNPVRIFSRADAVEQIRVRIDDKLSRLARGDGSASEDAVLDLLGYLVLLRVTEKRAAASAQTPVYDPTLDAWTVVVGQHPQHGPIYHAAATQEAAREILRAVPARTGGALTLAEFRAFCDAPRGPVTVGGDLRDLAAREAMPAAPAAPAGFPANPYEGLVRTDIKKPCTWCADSGLVGHDRLVCPCMEGSK